MTNLTPETLRDYPATQHLDLCPVIGIDPGARWTGIAVRIGRECVRAITIRNPATVRSGAHPDLVPVHRHAVVRRGHLVDEDVVARIELKVGLVLADPVLDAQARAAWAKRGLPLTPGETPWIIAIELTAEPRSTPDGQHERDGRVYTVGVREAGDYGATNAIAAALGSRLDPAIWIAPRSADVRHRWGTGNPTDYWPHNLLEPGDVRITGIPAEYRSDDPLGHVRAAYSVATDAGRVVDRDHPGRRPIEITPPDVRALRLAQLRGWRVTPQTPAQRLAASGAISRLPITTSAPELTHA